MSASEIAVFGEEADGEATGDADGDGEPETMAGVPAGFDPA
jgi:hypothetical protein